MRLKEIEDEKELISFRDFLLKQPQWYPSFKDWVDSKCVPRVERGEYKAIFAYSDGIIGDAVYRRLTQDTIEIKNFRIDEEYRHRDLGRFLLRQVEYDNPSSNLVLDVTLDNFSGIEFFVRNGFHIISREELYKKGQYELVMRK